MFQFKLVNRHKCLDNMKINGFSCSSNLGNTAGERYRFVLEFKRNVQLAYIVIHTNVFHVGVPKDVPLQCTIIDLLVTSDLIQTRCFVK